MDIDEYRKAIAQRIDTNGDGRLQASEYLAADRAVLNSAAASAAGGCLRAKKFLRDRSEEGFAERFDAIEKAYTPYFADGIETPQPSSLIGLHNEARDLSTQTGMGKAVRQSVSLWPLLKECNLANEDIQAEIEFEQRRRKRRATPIQI